MKTSVTEIAPDLFRLSTFHPQYKIQFNQFLIKDDQPFLMHTGFKKMFPLTVEAAGSVLDPAKIRWIAFSHFESDECGALNEWLRVAPGAEAVCTFVGAMVSVNDFADRPAREISDGETLPLGRRRIRLLATPHVPHGWDAGLFYEESEGTLLCSDLFFHPGNPEPLTESDLVGRARESMLKGQAGPLAKDIPYTPYTDATLRRLAGLHPKTLALMHGSSFRGDGGKALLDLAGAAKEILGNAENPAS